MPANLENAKEYQDIFHWAETQKDAAIPSFALRRNDPYEVCHIVEKQGANFLTQTLSINPASTTSKFC